MTIIDYFQCEDRQPWLRQIAQYEWSAARFLTKLLTEGRFHEAVGKGTLYLLTDGDALVSFLSLAERDCIDEPAWSPWIGFVHTAPEYRGHRHAGRLIGHACAIAREHGADRVHICTDHDGLYEKYGFTFLEDRVSIYGEMSHVLVRHLADAAPVIAADCAVRTNALDADTFLHLYRSVGWEAPGRDQVQYALDHSLATFLVTDGSRPVAMARLLGDMAMSCYVKDFAVLPECQGRGVGRLLMHAMEDYIRENRQNGWHMSLELIAARGMEGFYRKLGFEDRPCDWDGPGMFKMIRE